jgi:hypothetical protein
MCGRVFKYTSDKNSGKKKFNLKKLNVQVGNTIKFKSQIY